MARPQSKWLEQLIFLGTGTSSQVPAIHCVIGSGSDCVTCKDALRPGSFNRRGCTSAVVVGAEPGKPRSTILIDCGKTFYQSALTVFPKYGLERIDAVLLTHGHADAILGLDDLRSWTMGGCIQDQVDVYLTQECFETVKTTFPYLVNRSLATGGGDVGALRWHVVDATERFYVGPHSVPVDPLRVEHGFAGAQRLPFECLGFRIDSMSYVSDCHSIPDETKSKMLGSSVLVLDGLKMQPHTSHFSVPQALEFALEESEEQISRGHKAPLVLLTDVSHRMEHSATEEALQKLSAGLGGYRTNHPEATGRWWEAIWDARENEHTSMLLLKSPMDPAENHFVPQMHLVHDFQSIEFCKNVV